MTIPDITFPSVSIFEIQRYNKIHILIQILRSEEDETFSLKVICKKILDILKIMLKPA